MMQVGRGPSSLPRATSGTALPRPVRQDALTVAKAQIKPQKQVKKQAGKLEKNIKQSGLVERVFEAQEQLQQEISIKKLLQQSLIVSLTFGVVFQVTHNNGLLPVSSS